MKETEALVLLNLKRIRESKGLSQEQMAMVLGIAQNNYSLVELGKTKLTITRIFQIVKFLECSIYDLLEGIEPNEPPTQDKLPRGTLIAFQGFYLDYDKEGNAFLTTKHTKK
jgi:transcriptional regulator with XRE-family HTH domain